MTRLSRAFLSGVLASLLSLGALQLAQAQERERRLEVSYTPPVLSVEARGVSVLQVLQAIGASVGFSTIDAGVVRPTLAVTLQDATLDEVLRQVLRGENVAIIYRGEVEGTMQGSGAIETIILFGPRAAGEAAAGSNQGQHLDADDRSLLPGSRRALHPFNALLPNQAGRAAFEALERAQDRNRGEAAAAVTVQGLLRAHAMSSVADPSADMPQEATPGYDTQDQANRAPPAEAVTTGIAPTELLEPLALTTRLAQQHLQALLEGLNTATSSLLDSVAGR